MNRWSLALTMLTALTVSSAQNLDDSYKLNVDVELVQLPVSVLDKQGVPVADLQQDDFTIYEDKVAQNISLFKREDVPLSVGLVIDASSSMLPKRDRLKTAALTFVRESNLQDETAILSFADDVVLEQAFTADTQKLSRAFASMSFQGNTALYDAVFMAAKYVEHNGSHEKKVLIVVSDGEDNRSQYTLKQALRLAAEAKIAVYTVGLLKSGFSLREESQLAKDALKGLAEVTGGASFFPKDVQRVEEICARIARDLRSQYMLGYRPSNQNLDGSWRKVQVRVVPPKNTGKINVRTKQGYYAPLAREARERQSGVVDENGVRTLSQ
jgi:Ca-activated chloride channel homolog